MSVRSECEGVGNEGVGGGGRQILGSRSEGVDGVGVEDAVDVGSEGVGEGSKGVGVRSQAAYRRGESRCRCEV